MTWNVLPIGGGGFFTSISIAKDGTKYATSDTNGAWKWDGTKWNQLITYASIEQFWQDGADGAWDLRCAPTNANRVIMVAGFANLSKVYLSVNGGASWTPAKIGGVDFVVTNANANLYPLARSKRHLAIDPNNELIAYFGTPHNSSPNNGAYISTDGGANWTKIADINAAVDVPGCAGLCIDESSTTTVNGQTRSARVIIPMSGVGIYESTDGGQSFGLASTPASSPITLTLAATAGDVIIVQAVYLATLNSVTSSPALTFNARVTNYNNGGGGMMAEHYAIATATTTYTITLSFADGGLDGMASAFAVAGCDTTSESTIFDSAGPQTAGQSGTGASITTTNATDMLIVVFNAGHAAAADPGWTTLYNNPQDLQIGFWSECLNVTSTGTFQPSLTGIFGANWGAVIDAIKGGTLRGSAVFGLGAIASAANVWAAQIEYGTAAGKSTYWFNNQGRNLWRRWWDGAAWQNEQMDGHGGLQAGYFASPNTGGTVCVDPRQGHAGKVVISGPGQAFVGWQTTNDANLPRSSVTWDGSSTRDPDLASKYSGDIPWMVATQRIPSVAEMCIDPVDGKFWMAQGIGAHYFPALTEPNALNYGTPIPGSTSTPISVWPVIRCNGIENTVMLDVTKPVGWTQVMGALGDLNILPMPMTGYPASVLGTTQHNAAQMDWCSSNPLYLYVVVPDGVVGDHPDQSSYVVNSSGTITTTELANKPPRISGGGNCAFGSFDPNTKASAVISAYGDNTSPYYSDDMGTTAWGQSNLPSRVFAAPYHRARSFAADRINVSTFYAYLDPTTPGNAGIYISTDKGHTWSRQSSFAPPTVSGGSNANADSIIRSSPCHSIASVNYSDLFITAGHGDGLYISTNQGVTWTALPETHVNIPATGQPDSVRFGFGKANTPGGYATLYYYGSVNGITGFWRLTDFAGISGGATVGTWTQFGTKASLPLTCQRDFVQIVDGDMDVFGRFFLGMTGSGGAFYDPSGVPLPPPTEAVAITAITTDTGTPGDFITTDTTLIVSGTNDALAVGDRIQVSSDGGNTWHDVVQNTATTWSYDDTGTTHAISFTYLARVIDATNNVGNTTSQLITIELANMQTVTTTQYVVGPP